MTTEQPTAPRLLRRRTEDRVIGGVASGLGDYLNIDPLLIRIAFVGLMVFGGLGLFLYLGGWLLIPEEATNKSIGEQIIERAGLTPTRFLVAALAVAGFFIFFGGLGGAVAEPGFATAFGAAILVVLVGGWFLRRGEHDEAIAAATVAAPAAAAVPTVSAQPVTRRRAVRRRPRSPLGGYVLGAALAAIGLLALAVNVSGADVVLGQYFGLALGVFGVGLVVGTWWGHARVLILLGALLVPFAVVASLITAPIEGGIGYHRFHPANVEELRDEYRLVGGSVVLDLTDLEPSREPIDITASVALGEVFVALPADAAIEIDARVGAGTLVLLGEYKEGTSVEDRVVRDGSGQQFVLHLETGIGTVYVENCCNAVNH